MHEEYQETLAQSWTPFRRAVSPVRFQNAINQARDHVVVEQKRFLIVVEERQFLTAVDQIQFLIVAEPTSSRLAREEQMKGPVKDGYLNAVADVDEASSCGVLSKVDVKTANLSKAPDHDELCRVYSRQNLTHG